MSSEPGVMRISVPVPDPWEMAQFAATHVVGNGLDADEVLQVMAGDYEAGGADLGLMEICGLEWVQRFRRAFAETVAGGNNESGHEDGGDEG